MKTLELNQKIKVGKYECEVVKDFNGNYLHIEGEYSSASVTQFLKTKELCNKFYLNDDGGFPYCNSLEQLTKVVEYLKSFEKPEFKRGDVILVWNEHMKKYERIFFEYVQGNEFPFMCVDESDDYEYKENKSFKTYMWQFAEPIPQTKQITKDEIKKAFDCEDFEIID